MTLSPLKAPAAPVQDAPRKISTPQQQPAQHQSGLHRSPANPATHRPSNPALLAATGSSGFDARAHVGGPRLSLPDQGAPTPVKGNRPEGASGAAPTQGVGKLEKSAVDSLFDKGSSVFEKILADLGQKDLPQIDDPTEKLKQRTEALGTLLKSDSSLTSKISPHLVIEANALSKIFSSADFQGLLNDEQKKVVGGFNQVCSLMASRGEDWPPPPLHAN